MKQLTLALGILLLLLISTNLLAQQSIQVGAERLEQYLPLLNEQKVALVVNQTSEVNNQHLVDLLLANGVEIVRIFAPEHGFRGKADAGAQVKDGKDAKTGLPIISLYGKNKKPQAKYLIDVDKVIFDIQDVGARFYTYISTMHYVMEACAENNKPLIILDRPNPNGHYVDGPILDPAYQSFVGMHEIPVVHGLTVGELAQMINGEKWLKDQAECDLTIIKCLAYDHNTYYSLPIKPSPNLPNMRSIYLYPSLCFFEGTPISVGRGTQQQFQLIGSPELARGGYQFTPVSSEGAKYPKHENKICNGKDLSKESISKLASESCLNLSHLLEIYQLYPNKAKFFNENLFFDKLAGTDRLRKQIIAGQSEEEIRKSWAADLAAYKSMRKEYLLYPDFE